MKNKIIRFPEKNNIFNPYNGIEDIFDTIMCRADSGLTEEDKIKVSHAKASFQEAFWSSMKVVIPISFLGGSYLLLKWGLKKVNNS